jgi:hypothetical protein
MSSSLRSLPVFRRALVRVALLTLVACSVSCGSDLSSDARHWWSHVEFLAADRLTGRNTGSDGYREAANYVAEQFRANGAEPGGTDGYDLPVPLIARQIREPQSSLALVRGDSVEPLTLGEDANIGMSLDPADSIEAPLVFAGYGLSVPEAGYDDLKGLDLTGGIAVCMQGGPASIDAPLRSHAQSTAERWSRLRAAGAIGVVSIANPRTMDIPWERATLARLRPSMTLADSDLVETPGERISIRINPAHAAKLFAGSGHRFEDILAAADHESPLPRFPLGARLRARVSHTTASVTSPDVVGIIRGSDPKLRDEYVVLSAHLDHLGIGGAIEGDSIYNGAMDNASGVASLIEIARHFHRSKIALKRSIILLAVTGEEKGLLGSKYFAERPPVPLDHIVADVNMDMFLPIFPFRYLTVFGLDESDLGDDARAMAARFGVDVQRDPEPQRNRFIRSDQYSFIRKGIPALAFKIGYAADSPEEKAAKQWTRDRYHAPSDDLKQPVDREAAARFTRFLLEFSTRVANAERRPQWKERSFFKRFAAPTSPS